MPALWPLCHRLNTMAHVYIWLTATRNVSIVSAIEVTQLTMDFEGRKSLLGAIGKWALNLYDSCAFVLYLSCERSCGARVDNTIILAVLNNARRWNWEQKNKMRTIGILLPRIPYYARTADALLRFNFRILFEDNSNIFVIIIVNCKVKAVHRR